MKLRDWRTSRWGVSVLRFVRYAVVGASGFVVNEGLLFLGHGVVRLPVVLASLLAVECAIVWNYLLNDRWTFQHSRPSFDRFWRFQTVSLVGLLLNAGLLAGLTHFSHLYYLAANGIAVVVVMAVNYILNAYWTYGKVLTAPETAMHGPAKPRSDVPTIRAS